MQPPNQPQKNKSSAKDSASLVNRVSAVKSALKLKGLNVTAAAAGHKAFQQHSQKNPNAQISQVLNKISPLARQNYLKVSSEIPPEMLSSQTPQNIFRTTLQRIKSQKDAIQRLNNSVEILDKEQISESLNEEFYPPALVLLKRTGIRIFPDGRRVALYTNDKLGLVFSVPYNKSTGVSTPSNVGGLLGVTAEETDLSEEMIDENIEHIKDIVKNNQAKKLKFQDGTTLNVDAQTAKAIHLVHDALNDENKAKVARMISHSKGQFMKVADFANKNTAYKIDK